MPCGFVGDRLTALDAAEKAMAEWARISPRQRCIILSKAFTIMSEKLEEIADLITLENGKPYADAMGEATYAAEFFRWYAEEAVRIVSFTGSTEVGRILLKEAADNIITPAMELGGNAPVIIFDDADIDVAVTGCMLAKMRNIGEACTAANRA